MNAVFRFLIVPGEIEPTLRRVAETDQGVAVNGMDGDADPGGDDADDAVAGQRAATFGEMHRDAGYQAANGDRRVSGLGRARAAAHQRESARGDARRRRVGKQALMKS